MRRTIFRIAALLRQPIHAIVDWFARMCDVFLAMVRPHRQKWCRFFGETYKGFVGRAAVLLGPPKRLFKTLWNATHRILLGILIVFVIVGSLYGTTTLLTQDSCFRSAEKVTGDYKMREGATFTPNEVNFADMVLAEYVLVMGTDGSVKNIDDLVVSEPDFTPYEIIGEPVVEREVVCGELIITWSAQIECLGSLEDPEACLPSANPDGFSFDNTRVPYTFDWTKTVDGKEEFIKEIKSAIIIKWPKLKVRSFMTAVDILESPVFDPGPYNEPKNEGIEMLFGTVSYKSTGITIILVAVAGLIIGLLFTWKRYVYVSRKDNTEPEWLIELRALIEHARNVYQEPPGTDNHRAVHAIAEMLRNTPNEELRELSNKFETLAHPKKGADSGTDVNKLLAELSSLLSQPDEGGEQ